MKEKGKNTETNKNIGILSGNELIIKGGLEAGIDLYTGYPGSPLADYFNILFKSKKKLQTLGVKAVLANSESNAAAMASGAKQAGKDVLLAMKSMGLHVAADALFVGNFADPGEKKIDEITHEELSPAVVVVVGDDPWSLSTSAPADSRYLFKHLHIPFLEPSTPQELKDWIGVAKKISQKSSLYQGLLLTTFMAEGGGSVSLFEDVKRDNEVQSLDTKNFDLQKNLLVPPNSLMADQSMIRERFPRVKEIYFELNLDKSFGRQDSKIGFISSGVIFETLKQVLEETSLLDQTNLYKLASSYPLVEKKLIPFLSQLDHLIVVEEKRGFLEAEIKELIQENDLNIVVWGKSFGDKTGFPASGGLDYEIIFKNIKNLSSLNIGLDKNLLSCDLLKFPFDVPSRLPTFCPGCPHRETLSLLKDLRQKLDQKGIDLISHGDVGCYSLSFLPPFKEMHSLSAMGQGGALGSGVDIFTSNPSVVLMGDSTFFHSGMTDISHSIQMGHSITYILLDNANTAMTGHQMTPRTGISVDGISRPKQNIETIVSGLGVGTVMSVNPSDRYFYQNLLMETVLSPGVKVIISNKECGLTYYGKKKAQDRKSFARGETKEVQSFYQINTDACEDCRECVDMTGCPGLTLTHDPYGTKIMIDPQICVGDSYCTKLKSCPSFERVDVYDYHPTLYLKKSYPDLNEDGLAEPKKQFDVSEILAGRNYHIVITGVGGSGVTTISRVLSQAALSLAKENAIEFKFMDQKGLAQRNGNVTGHLAFFKKGRSLGAVTPRGKADLFLSPDLMDSARQVSFISPKGFALVDRTFQVPLVQMLDREVTHKSRKSREYISALESLLDSRIHFADFKKIAYQKLGKSVYASSMILGAAYQSGHLPFSLKNLFHAYELSMPKNELDNNWKAFFLGREVYLGKISAEANKNTYHLYEKSITDGLPFWQNSIFLLKFYRSDLSRLKKYLPEISENFLARYLHDIYIYNRGKESEKFVNQTSLLKKLYPEKEHLEIAVRTLARTYWIKDEVFVSHLMVSPMRKELDQQNYGHLGRRFCKIFNNRPCFEIMGFSIEFDFSPTRMMLKIMRHMRFIRIFTVSQHNKEREIARKIRYSLVEEVHKITNNSEIRVKLKELENIKGYRHIRFKKAKEVFGDK